MNVPAWFKVWDFLLVHNCDDWILTVEFIFTLNGPGHALDMETTLLLRGRFCGWFAGGEESESASLFFYVLEVLTSIENFLSRPHIVRSLLLYFHRAGDVFTDVCLSVGLFKNHGTDFHDEVEGRGLSQEEPIRPWRDALALREDALETRHDKNELVNIK